PADRPGRDRRVRRAHLRRGQAPPPLHRARGAQSPRRRGRRRRQRSARAHLRALRAGRAQAGAGPAPLGPPTLNRSSGPRHLFDRLMVSSRKRMLVAALRPGAAAMLLLLAMALAAAHAGRALAEACPGAGAGPCPYASGNFIASWGHKGTQLGQFRFFSSQNPTQPPGGGIAVAGGYVYVADSGNNRIERFSLGGSEAMAWGGKGSGPGQFTYPRGLAANA